MAKSRANEEVEPNLPASGCADVHGQLEQQRGDILQKLCENTARVTEAILLLFDDRWNAVWVDGPAHLLDDPFPHTYVLAYLGSILVYWQQVFARILSF